MSINVTDNTDAKSQVRTKLIVEVTQAALINDGVFHSPSTHHAADSQLVMIWSVSLNSRKTSTQFDVNGL